MEISIFSLLSYWNLYFLFTFLLKSLLSVSATSELSCQCGCHSAVEFPNNMPHIAFLSAASELSCQCVSQSAIAFPNNIPRIAFLSANSEPSCQCVWHSAIAFPNRTTHTEKSTKTYASISTGSGAETVPQPRRNRAAPSVPTRATVSLLLFASRTCTHTLHNFS